MKFWAIGNLNSYMNSIKLQQKWKQKKISGDFTSDESMTEKQRLNEQFKKSYMEHRNEDDNDETLSVIYTKINSGSKLTDEEMKYLQIKNPMAYQKVKNREAEKINYEKELKRCKTKDDVKRLKMSKINGALASINSVKSNPNIPDGKKLEVITEINIKINAINKITNKFIKSGEYDVLPTDAEKRKAELDMKRAEQEAAEKVYSSNTEETACAENIEYTANNDEKSKKENMIFRDNEMTVTEAENTPEAMKVKRSKAKKAYHMVDENYTDKIKVRIEKYEL